MLVNGCVRTGHVTGRDPHPIKKVVSHKQSTKQPKACQFGLEPIQASAMLKELCGRFPTDDTGGRYTPCTTAVQLRRALGHARQCSRY